MLSCCISAGVEGAFKGQTQKPRMSSWPLAGENISSTSWSSVSQFEEMMWDGFGDADEHIVPNPEGSARSVCLSISDRRKRLHCEATPLSLERSGNFLEKVGQEAVQKSRFSDLTNEENDKIVGLSNSEDDYHYIQAPVHKERWDSLFGGNLAAGANRLLEDKPTCLGRNNAESGTCVGSSARQCLIKEESSDLVLSGLFPNDSLCQEDDPSILSHSSPFSLFEVRPEEPDFELFGAQKTADKRGTLLDFSWEDIDNLDDMDALFQEANASFGQETDGCLYPLAWSSSQGLDVSTIGNSASSENCPSTIPPTTLEVMILKSEETLEYAYQDSTAEAVKEDPHLLSSDLRDPQFSSVQANELPLVNAGQSCSENHQAGSLCCTNDMQLQGKRGNGSTAAPQYLKTESMDKDLELSSQSCSSADKGGRARQRPSIHRNKFKREIPHKRSRSSTHYSSEAFQISTQAQHLQLKAPELWGLTPSVPTSFKRLSPAFEQPPFMLADPLFYQQRPVPPPAVLMGSGPYFPVLIPDPSSVIPQQQHSRPLAGCQHFFLEKQNPDSIPTKVLDAPMYLRFNDNKTTPLEKVEKLHFQDTMQARLGGDQHLLNLETLQAAVDSKEKEHKGKQLQGRASMAVGTTSLMYPSDEELGSSNHEIPMSAVLFNDDMKERETSAEEVLHQLQTLVLKLDARTRLCIRDALYRLAKSATHRRGVGDNGSCIGSTEEPFLEPYATNSAHEENTLVDGVPRLPEINVLEAAGKNVVEAETNRIDRTIANMLFHKTSHSPGRPFAPSSAADTAFNVAAILPFP